MSNRKHNLALVSLLGFLLACGPSEPSRTESTSSADVDTRDEEQDESLISTCAQFNNYLLFR